MVQIESFTHTVDKNTKQIMSMDALCNVCVYSSQGPDRVVFRVNRSHTVPKFKPSNIYYSIKMRKMAEPKCKIAFGVISKRSHILFFHHRITTPRKKDSIPNPIWH